MATVECCDFTSPIILGDTTAVITVVAGGPDDVDDILVNAEGCDCGYCLAPHHRVLTSDLRWVPCGEVEVGDELLAFEEERQPGNRNRRFQRAIVTHSHPAVKECVRVHFDNGDAIECSLDHPWLVSNHKRPKEWVIAEDLMKRGLFASRMFVPWEPDYSFEAGWLSGMFDGEGCLSWSQLPDGRIQVHLAIAQNPGPVLDRVQDGLAVLKFKTTTHYDKKSGTGDVYVAGFQEMLHVLGVLRPIRLLETFAKMPVEKCSFIVKNPNASLTRIIAVEPIGQREVQTISTTTGTYIGEGYPMHNSDTYDDIYCDTTEGGLFPNARLTDFEFTIDRIPANHELVIDAVERVVKLLKTGTNIQVGGLDVMSWNGVFEWIESAKGGCVRICVDATEAHTNPDTTVVIETYDREL